MIRRPPRSTLDRSSAASDVYKRQVVTRSRGVIEKCSFCVQRIQEGKLVAKKENRTLKAVSYTHLRAHETVLDLVCRLLLEKKKKDNKKKKKNTEQNKH